MCLLFAGLSILHWGSTRTTAQDWTLGLRGGAVASRLFYQDDAARSLVLATPGFHAGAMVGRRLRGKLWLQAEALYTQKGFDSDDEQLRLAYVQFPVLAVVRWPAGWSPHLFVGPSLGFETACRSSRVPALGEVDCDDALARLQRERIDFGLTAGAGIGARSRSGELFLDVLVDIGLRDLNREPRPPGKVANQALLVSLGYRRSFGGRL